MGGSRRRLKRSQPKVKVGMGHLKRKKIEKTKLPLEIADERPHDKLKQEIDWSEEKTLTTNYQRNNLLMDPNQGFGRNKSAEPLKSSEERHAANEETFSDDDELRAGCNLERNSGKAPPPRLTTTQKTIVKRLIEKYGEDHHAMVLDRKLNPMQHSAGQLKKLIQGYQHWEKLGDKAGHDFWGAQKPYKKL